MVPLANIGAAVPHNIADAAEAAATVRQATNALALVGAPSFLAINSTRPAGPAVAGIAVGAAVGAAIAAPPVSVDGNTLVRAAARIAEAPSFAAVTIAATAELHGPMLAGVGGGGAAANIGTHIHQALIDIAGLAAEIDPAAVPVLQTPPDAVIATLPAALAPTAYGMYGALPPVLPDFADGVVNATNVARAAVIVALLRETQYAPAGAGITVQTLANALRSAPAIAIAGGLPFVPMAGAAAATAAVPVAPVTVTLKIKLSGKILSIYPN
jgi:hypothetical protein